MKKIKSFRRPLAAALVLSLLFVSAATAVLADDRSGQGRALQVLQSPDIGTFATRLPVKGGGMLPIPLINVATHPARRHAARRGEALFASVGDTACHVAEMRLESRYISEPSPFNPTGNLRRSQVARAFHWHMRTQGPMPRLQRDGRGAIVRDFTDLKHHGPSDADWPAPGSVDSILTEPIHCHGGEARSARDAFFALPQAAVIEFLRSL